MNTKILLLLAALTSSVMAASAEESTIIMNPKRVVITESAAGMDTEIIGYKNDTIIFKQQYSPNATIVSHISKGGLSLLGDKRKKRSGISWDATSEGFGIGFCSAPGAPGGSNVEQGKSFEVSWLNIIAAKATNRHGNSFTMGVGIDWRNWRTTLDSRFTVTDGIVGTGSYPEGASPRLSRIKVFSVQFPMLWHQNLPAKLFGSQMQMVFGPIFNLNTHGSVLTSWYEDGHKIKDSVNGINLRLFTVDLFAMARIFPGAGVFVRYSPYKMLTGSQRFNFHPFSTGLMFLM